MKLLLVEPNGELCREEIPEADVCFHLGGAPLTFCGTIDVLDVVVLVKEDCTGKVNPYKIPGIDPYKGRALIIQTNEEGVPVDLNFDAYDKWYATSRRRGTI